MESFNAFNRILSQPDATTRNKEALLLALQAFSDTFVDPETKFGKQNEADNLKPLLSLIMHDIPIDIEILAAKVIKILLRKPQNRVTLGRSGVGSIVRALHRQEERLTSSAAEIGNVVLNTCYEGDNIDSFIEENGIPPLLNLLYSNDDKVIASALGAIQGLCFISSGRRAIRSVPNVTLMYITIYFPSKLFLVPAFSRSR